MKKENNKIPSINGLRGIAILMVIFEHSLAQKISQKTGFYYILDQGWTGVNLFFILSGFVLAKPYLSGERQFSSKQDITWFYKHRFLRLYPLFIFSCLVCYLLLIPVTKESSIAFLEVITCMSVFTKHGFYNVLNPVLWTLQIEVLFSLVFPLLIIAINKIGGIKSLLLTLFISLVIRIIGMDYKHDVIQINPIKDSILGRLDDFMIGMMIYKLYKDQKTHFNHMLLFLMGSAGWLTGALLWDLRQNDELPSIITPFINNIFQLSFGSLLILALNKSLFSKLISFYPLQLLGSMCFSIYIWHALLLHKFQSNHDLLDYALYFVSVIILSAFTYRFIEFRKTDSLKKVFLLDQGS